MQRSLLQNFLKVGGYKYTGEFVVFLGSIFISRYLTPDEYGVVAVVLIFYNFLALFSDLGFTSAIVREKEDSRFLSIAQTFFLLNGALIGLILLLLAYPISIFFHDNRLFHLSLLYAFILFIRRLPLTSEAVLLKKKKFIITARTEFLVASFTVLLIFILAVSGFSYWSLVLPYMLSPFIYFYYYRSFHRVPFRLLTRADLKLIRIKFGSLFIHLGSFNFTNYWEKNADKFLIGRLYGKSDLGIYNRAYMLVNLPSVFLAPLFRNVFFPIFQEKFDQPEYIKQEYKKLLHLISSISIVPWILLLYFPFEISTFLWGENWSRVGDYLGLLAIPMVLYVISGTTPILFILFREEKRLHQHGTIAGISTIGALTVGVFFSMKTMIYFFILNTLFIVIPSLCYFGFYKSFKFSMKEILEIWIVNYVVVAFLFVLIFFEMRYFMLYPLIFIGTYALIRFFLYIREFLLADSKT
ncbi:oligosaccharide flippase family protein [Fulvivirgaceae bacterium BMA10]|uniref:Oligosaccharide flippase family protein n=1 Tax=Splendidivirga corallicola TaxID=3051826 RepID=A0ABT8KRJ0_9BACT|nr:oligosaccharide flippase family protein [Fulvivirgaceae bacterium BMA10]